MSTRREFLAKSSAVTVGAALGTACSGDSSQLLSGARGASAALLASHPEHPEPASFDRLSLAWHQDTVRRLQDKLRERGLDGILITDRWNIIYFTGLFHTTTERPFACFIPTDELAVHWFHPGLDLEMVKSWWSTDEDYYYDFPHTEGGNPRESSVVAGPAVDLIEWRLQGVARRGYGDKRIGLSQAPTMGAMARMQEVLPNARFEDVSDICIGMRRVKTAEELALSQRAYNYFSQIHAWTRDYILEHGTDLTDFKVHMAATEYGTDLIMTDIARDGRPHTAVGLSIGISCRTGVGNAFPHPNQFHHNPLRRGDSLQVSGGVKIGGCGGELYCPYQLGPWDPEWERVWEVMAEGSEMQIRLSKVGTPCNEIARAIHAYQVEQGMQPYLYQRVAHGEGMEGHQQPYIALGDETLLEENMTFSMEPGLFNPEGGYGYNPSDSVVVGRDSGWVQGSVPNLTKEWALLQI